MTAKTLTILSALIVMIAASPVFAQPQNLLRNPNADLQTQFWQTFGETAVETSAFKSPFFVVTNGGYFCQEVPLPKDASGKYALFIGLGASERINAYGAITGLPYLYGYMMSDVSPRKNRILDYLQGQNMRAAPTYQLEWVPMWGIFHVPNGTGSMRFFLKQALRNGMPHNGSAAYFDDLGLYLFETEEEAQTFVNYYR